MKPADETTAMKVFVIVILLGMITGVVAYKAFPDLFYGQFLIPAA